MSVHKFQAEVNDLLHLIIHSLYSHKEIFLRELISNASDALDKLRYLTTSDEAYKSITFEPSITISFNDEKNTLTIEDTGIGMNEQDLIDNLGTIARSGTKRFMEAIAQASKKDMNLIGQFGVGFYASYMVAETVSVLTRKAGEDAAWLWTSDGKGSFSIEPAEKASHGTCITLTMNDEGKEFLSRWRLESLIKKYSNHIAFPIFLEWDGFEYDDKGKKKDTKIHRKDQINSAKALWSRSKQEITTEEYIDFYKNITDSEENPLYWIHTKAEGTIEYTTLFYIPEKAPFDLYHADYKPGVKLYVKRVFITDDDKELLPTYLRFVRGIIDSEDLPLNVSREILQQNRIMNTIRSASVKKILSELKELSERDPEKYAQFIIEFNRPIKEGIYSDFANKETLLELVRFKSTAVDGWTSLADYKKRMKDGQKAIYYLTGESEERVRKSPILEMYKKEGIEVLLCFDEIDELVIPMIGRYGDIELKAANRTGAEEDIQSKEAKQKQKENAPLAEKIKKALGDLVKDVRVSSRLSESPACIILDEQDPSMQMAQLMKALGRGEEVEVRPILEINPDHALLKKAQNSESDELTSDIAHVLLNQALLLEGVPIKDPSDFVTRLNRLLSQ